MAGAAGLINADEAEGLIDAHKLYTDATQFMRLSTSGAFDPAMAPAGVKRRIAAASGFPDFEAFTAALDEARKRVRAAFAAIVVVASGIIRVQTGVVIDPTKFHPVMLVAPASIVALAALIGIFPAIKAYRPAGRCRLRSGMAAR